MSGKKKTVSMPMPEFLEEHSRLMKVLLSPSRKDDKAEMKKQSKEVQKYKKNGKSK